MQTFEKWYKEKIHKEPDLNTGMDATIKMAWDRHGSKSYEDFVCFYLEYVKGNNCIDENDVTVGTFALDTWNHQNIKIERLTKELSSVKVALNHAQGLDEVIEEVESVIEEAAYLISFLGIQENFIPDDVYDRQNKWLKDNKE